MKYVVLNNNEEVIFSTISDFEKELLNSTSKKPLKYRCATDECEKRRVVFEVEVGKIYFESKNRTLVRNNQLFLRACKISRDVLTQFLILQQEAEERQNSIVDRLFHNVVRLNGSSLQRLYTLIPEDRLTGNVENQIETINDIVKGNTIEVSKLLFRLIKDSLFIKTEFAAFKALNSPNRTVKKSKYHLRKVLLQAYHVFYYQFKEKNISVYFENYSERVQLNYPSINPAFVHIFHNAAKYVCPNTTIEVQFIREAGYVDLVFDMISLQITDQDIKYIFDEGYSGELPRKLGTAGEGIGLNVVKLLLKLNDATVKIMRNVDPLRKIEHEGATYENNRMSIRIRL